MEQLLNDKQLAEYLGVSLPTIYRWAADDKLPTHYIVGGKRRYDMAQIKKYLEDVTNRNNNV